MKAVCWMGTSKVETLNVDDPVLLNPRDAMLRGGTLTIRTGVETLDFTTAAILDVAPGPYVTIDVEDTGGGMDETTRTHGRTLASLLRGASPLCDKLRTIGSKMLGGTAR